VPRLLDELLKAGREAVGFIFDALLLGRGWLGGYGFAVDSASTNVHG
jgi:hypothetical protein